MKIFPIALASHYLQTATTVAYAMKLIRRNPEDGSIVETLGFTSHDKNKTISSVLYRASPGLSVSNIAMTSGTAVGNLELTTLNDGSVFTRTAILNRVWSNAEFHLFRFNWQSVTDGVENILSGTLGEIKIHGAQLVIELRDWRQYIQQPIGSLSTKTCRYRFGDGKCKKDITTPPLRVTGSVTTAGQASFTDSTKVQVADFFGEGEIFWTSGNNLGAWVKVKEFASGVFTLVNSMYGLVQVGDTFVAIAGCRKRFEEDCITKHANGVNFGGEPHRQGLNSLTAAPGESQT